MGRYGVDCPPERTLLRRLARGLSMQAVSGSTSSTYRHPARHVVSTGGNPTRRETKMIRSFLMSALVLTSVTGCATKQPAAIQFLNPGTVLPTGFPFSEAVRAGDTLYLSGMVGVKPGTAELVEGGIEAESHRTMENIRMTLEAHGASMDHVVKCTVMLADISEWSTFNEIYQTYFNGRYPARSALGANGLALGARIEVDCIAAIGSD